MTIRVPASVRRAVRLAATAKATTDRAIVLEGLRAIGISVPEDAIHDQRTARAKLGDER